jgi:dienelactone hydrolase
MPDKIRMAARIKTTAPPGCGGKSARVRRFREIEENRTIDPACSSNLYNQVTGRKLMTENLIEAGAAAALGLTPIFAGEPAASRRWEDDIHVLGREIRVDVFEPEDCVQARVVLLLHGIGGLLGDGALMRRAARMLAAQGFRACVVHYFNATGTFFATHSNVREHTGDWTASLAGIARHYAEAHAPIGMLGYSLGGFLGVRAATEVPGVGAVAVMSGGLLEEHEDPVPPHLPALLVLHGADDAKVHPERAEALLRLGRRTGAHVEGVFYPHEGHTLGARAERDALRRTARFFAARLETGARR